MLHGNEAVIPQGAGHQLANEIAVSLGKISEGGDPELAGVGDSEGQIVNQIFLDGKEVASWIEKQSKNGRVRIHKTAIREF